MVGAILHAGMSWFLAWTLILEGPSVRTTSTRSSGETLNSSMTLPIIALLCVESADIVIVIASRYVETQQKTGKVILTIGA